MKSILLFLLLIAAALFTGLMTVLYPSRILITGAMVIVVFLITFLHIEAGLYILIFSMLLSPEFTAGGTGGSSLGRGVTLRLEDFLLIIIAFGWLARNAFYKEIGMVRRNPLNRPIFLYITVCLLSTALGVVMGRIDAKTSFFFVLKYFEYFIVFFIMVNYARDTRQVRRLMVCILVTAFLVSLYGLAQAPSGVRVSAPFEGQEGEPNTFGGYMVFILSLAAGFLYTSRTWKIRAMLIALFAVALISLLFTGSRSSYLALVAAVFVFGLMTRSKALALGIILFGLLVSPLFLPDQAKDRIAYTFTQRPEAGQITIGDLRLDTSTSARLISWRAAVKGWLSRPLLGYGVTGFGFVDAQYPRVLVETGAAGLAAFLYLLAVLFRLARDRLREARTDFTRGLAIGFFVGLVGIMVHAVGANTFIIVRIMEPFWFVAGAVTILPELEAEAEVVAA